MTSHRIRVVLPVALALIGAVLLLSVVRAETVLLLRIDVQTLLVLAYMLVLVFLAARVLVRRRAERTTQQRIAQIEAQAANDRRHFLGRLDHELKNPLTAIRAGIANLGATNELASDTVQSIAAQALRLSRLASDLRKLAELETQPLEAERVNIADLLHDLVALVEQRPDASARHLTLLVHQSPWPLTPVAGDQDLLFLALHNVLDNALKFTSPGATIEVRAFEHDAQIVIEVADTGPGIPPDEAPFVWDELYRGAIGRSIPGSGLGLPLVRAVAHRHGGQATLQSRVGHGTIVRVRLPVAHVSER